MIMTTLLMIGRRTFYLITMAMHRHCVIVNQAIHMKVRWEVVMLCTASLSMSYVQFLVMLFYLFLGIVLYDWSGVQLDSQSLQLLHHHKTSLQHLNSVLHSLLTSPAAVTQQGTFVARLHGVPTVMESLWRNLWGWKSHGIIFTIE